MRLGTARNKARLGAARRGEVWRGEEHGRARQGVARRGEERGRARHGGARLGLVRQGKEQGHTYVQETHTMLNTVVGSLVTHRYVWVDTTFTHTVTQTPRFQPAVWFGLVSLPGRMWGCTVLLESGAVYRALPPMAIAFIQISDNGGDDDDTYEEAAQTWDCYGTDFSVIEYPYLSGLSCLAKTDTIVRPGRHLFAVAPVGDPFSAQPEQAKEFHFIQLDSGRLTIQPTNRVVYQNASFTSTNASFPVGMKLQTDIYRCE